MPNLRKYDRGSREATRQVVDKLEEQMRQLQSSGRRKCSLSKSVVPVEVGYLRQVVEEAGLQRHVLIKRHAGNGCGRPDRLRVPKHPYSFVRLTAARHHVEHGPVTWEMELQMRSIGRSACREL